MSQISEVQKENSGIIEVLFNDSAAGALALAKSCAKGMPTDVESVGIYSDSDGNIVRETFVLEPYTGPTVDGSPSDIVSIWMLADVGDISDMADMRHRIGIWRVIVNTHGYIYGDDDDGAWVDEYADGVNASIVRLKNAANKGTPIRIWWSDASCDASGYYWAMTVLRDAAGPVTAVKIPSLFRQENAYKFGDAGALAPIRYSQLLQAERLVEPDERRALAAEWERLVTENAPLRAMINGRLCSVPVGFYDHILRRVIQNGECQVGMIIGRALIDGPGGGYDWWYAQRLRAMLASGELDMIKEDKPFIRSVIRISENHLNSALN